MTGRIFDGLKVIDCASFIAAPVAATIMGDFGAEVIKIEAPGGDPYRSLHRGPGMPDLDFDYAWFADNRSKRGFCLDLKAGCGPGRAAPNARRYRRVHHKLPVPRAARS